MRSMSTLPSIMYLLFHPSYTESKSPSSLLRCYWDLNPQPLREITSIVSTRLVGCTKDSCFIADKKKIQQTLKTVENRLT